MFLHISQVSYPFATCSFYWFKFRDVCGFSRTGAPYCRYVPKAHNVQLSPTDHNCGDEQRIHNSSSPGLGRQRSLEQELAALQMNLPAIKIRPTVKIGKEGDDYAQEELDRKRKYLHQITERLQKFS